MFDKSHKEKVSGEFYKNDHNIISAMPTKIM